MIDNRTRAVRTAALVTSLAFGEPDDCLVGQVPVGRHACTPNLSSLIRGPNYVGQPRDADEQLDTVQHNKDSERETEQSKIKYPIGVTRAVHCKRLLHYNCLSLFILIFMIFDFIFSCLLQLFSFSSSGLDCVPRGWIFRHQNSALVTHFLVTLKKKRILHTTAPSRH